MDETHNTAAGWLAIAGLYVWSVIEQLHPGAASGASFGCFFFLAFPDPTVGRWFEQLVRKFALLVFSWGSGYGIGSGLAASAAWSGWAMAGACGTAAMVATLVGALNLMVRNDGPLPRWLGAILDRFPASRGPSND